MGAIWFLLLKGAFVGTSGDKSCSNLDAPIATSEPLSFEGDEASLLQVKTQKASMSALTSGYCAWRAACGLGTFVLQDDCSRSESLCTTSGFCEGTWCNGPSPPPGLSDENWTFYQNCKYNPVPRDGDSWSISKPENDTDYGSGKRLARMSGADLFFFRKVPGNPVYTFMNLDSAETQVILDSKLYACGPEQDGDGLFLRRRAKGNDYLWLNRVERNDLKLELVSLQSSCQDFLSAAINEVTWMAYFKGLQKDKDIDTFNSLLASVVLFPVGMGLGKVLGKFAGATLKSGRFENFMKDFPMLIGPKVQDQLKRLVESKDRVTHVVGKVKDTIGGIAENEMHMGFASKEVMDALKFGSLLLQQTVDFNRKLLNNLLANGSNEELVLAVKAYVTDPGNPDSPNTCTQKSQRENFQGLMFTLHTLQDIGYTTWWHGRITSSDTKCICYEGTHDYAASVSIERRWGLFTGTTFRVRVHRDGNLSDLTLFKDMVKRRANFRVYKTPDYNCWGNKEAINKQGFTFKVPPPS